MTSIRDRKKVLFTHRFPPDQSSRLFIPNKDRIPRVTPTGRRRDIPSAIRDSVRGHSALKNTWKARNAIPQIDINVTIHPAVHRPDHKPESGFSIRRPAISITTPQNMSE